MSRINRMSQRESKREIAFDHSIPVPPSPPTTNQLTNVYVLGKLPGERDTKLREIINPGSGTIVAVSAGSSSHFMCLSENGRVYVCGQGIAGQLGLGKEKRATSELTEVEFETNVFIVNIACNFAQSAAITREGHLYVWGSGHIASWTPRLVDSLVASKAYVSSCALGWSHALAIGWVEDDATSAQKPLLFAFGNNIQGQLGLPKDTYEEFTLVNDLVNERIVHVSCGYQHSAAVSEDGRAFFWGTMAGKPSVRQPTQIALHDHKVISTSCCSNSVLLLTKSGKVFKYSDPTISSTVFRPVVEFVEELYGKSASQISSETNHSVVVIKSSNKVHSEVYVCGSTKNGVFGEMLEELPDLPRFTFCEEISSFYVFQIACASRFTVVLAGTSHLKGTLIGDTELSADGRKHTFEKTQMNFPVRCVTCNRFIFGLRHGMWKCVECGIMCHSKCRDQLPPCFSASFFTPASPTESRRPLSSRGLPDSVSPRENIEEQEAEVLRLWEKAQVDFARDFIRNCTDDDISSDRESSSESIGGRLVDSTELPMLGLSDEPASTTVSRSFERRKNPTEAKIKRKRSSSTNSRVESVTKQESFNSLTSELTSSTSSFETNSDAKADVSLSKLVIENDETERQKQIVMVRTKIHGYKKRLRELEEELLRLLNEDAASKREKTSSSSLLGEVSATDSSTDVSSPAQLRKSSIASRSTKPRPVSSRPSDRVVLSKSQMIIEKSWAIDPEQVHIEKQIGEGASAQVYLGNYRGQSVAVKVLKNKVGNKQLTDFQFEYNILREMKSKHNVYFYGACLNPNLCLLMEFCERGSLYTRLNDVNQRFKWGRMLKTATEICRGVSCLHSWEPQIVHRDLKSHNLLIDSNWNVKIADFGLARLNTTTMKKKTLGKLRGTYTYCAPEIYYSQPFTEHADVYSIGVILWEMVVRVIKGRYERPYSEFPGLEYDFQIIVQTARGKRCTIPPTCPASLAKIIRSCWHADPKVRPSSKELTALMQGLQKEYKANMEAWDWCILKETPNVQNDRLRHSTKG